MGQMVAGGHQTVILKQSMFSSVASCDLVCVAFTFAASNNIGILACGTI